MKICLVLIMIFGSISAYAQSHEWEFYASKRSLPSPSLIIENYTAKDEGEITNYYYQYTRNRRGRYDAKSKTVKFEDSAARDAFNFVKSRMEDSIYLLPLPYYDIDSLDFIYLTENNLIQDSCVVLNYNLYHRKWNRTDKSYENCVPVVYIQARQIDGERMIIGLEEDSVALLTLNVGIMEAAPAKYFREWILLYEAHRKFGLFKQVNLDSYFSRQRIYEEIRGYVYVLQKE